MRFRVDECCPQAIVDSLRAGGHDVRYAADTDSRASDAELVDRALAEDRIICTEDFDFGDLLIRDQRLAPGVIILFLPEMAPESRAKRLEQVLATTGFSPHDALTIVESHRVRRRGLHPPP
jgi:predicted nuclease of predicted toxin-antitoxin system